MATLMEYDILREMYSTPMAALTQLATQPGINATQFKEAENNFIRVWLNEVKRNERIFKRSTVKQLHKI